MKVEKLIALCSIWKISMFVIFDEHTRPSLHILLLADQLDTLTEGITGANTLLIIALTEFAGVKISSTVFEPMNQVGEKNDISEQTTRS